MSSRTKAVVVVLSGPVFILTEFRSTARRRCGDRVFINSEFDSLTIISW